MEKNILTFEFVHGESSKKNHFLGCIRNSDNGIFIVKGLIKGDEYYRVYYDTVLDKNHTAQLIMYNRDDEININEMYLLGEDVLGNSIKYKLILDLEKNNIESLKEIKE